MENNKEEILKVGKPSKTYSDLWQHKEDHSTLGFCLAEFIDNSISSCEEVYWNNNIDHKLEIEIIFDEKKDLYIIKDNAGGMDLDNLYIAMDLKEKNTSEIDNSKLNQYGVGMKSAIFWIGKDADIYTKRKNDEEFCGKYNSSSKNRDRGDNVEYSILSSNENKINYDDSGTIIYIYECYGSDRAMTENKWETVDYFLGNRYAKYLNKSSNNNHECTIKIKSTEFKENEEKFVKPKTIENSNEVWKYDSNKSNFKDASELEKFLDEKLSEITKNCSDAFKQICNEFKHKVINSEELRFNDTIYFDNIDKNNRYSAPVKICILKEPSRSLCGLAILHSKRYICHPVLTKKEDFYDLGGMYTPWGTNVGFAKGKYRWIWAELDLSKIEGNQDCKWIKPERNKKLIYASVDSNISMKEFKNSINDLFIKWAKFAEIIYSISMDGKIEEREIQNYENKKIDMNREGNNIRISKLFNDDENIEAIVSFVNDSNREMFLSLVEEPNNNEMKKIYKYICNLNNAYFESLNEKNTTYVIKLLTYLDIFFIKKKGEDISNFSISEIIKNSFKYWCDK